MVGLLLARSLLLLAALFAAILQGVGFKELAGRASDLNTILGDGQLRDPRDAVQTDSYDRPRELPYGLLEAVKELQDCEPLQEVLGKRFVRLYTAVKQQEFEEFMRVISPWEREHLLLNV